jgi:hypothetical protein
MDLGRIAFAHVAGSVKAQVMEFRLVIIDLAILEEEEPPMVEGQ